MSASVVELRADCRSCHLENGVVERYDTRSAACRFGIPVETECSLCGTRSLGVTPPAAIPPAGGPRECPRCEEPLEPMDLDRASCHACGCRAELRQVSTARRLSTPAEVQAALDHWADREGLASREALLKGTLVVPSVDVLCESLARGARIETVVDPFALSASCGGRIGGNVRPSARVTEQEGRPAAPQEAPARAILYPLVSVIAADGEIHVRERALVDRFLAAEGMSPLSDHECMVHLPAEVAGLVPVERRETLVELMCEAASVDGMPDATEIRLIHAYASAWDIPWERVSGWIDTYERRHASPARALWMSFQRLLLLAGFDLGTRSPAERAETREDHHENGAHSPGK